MPLPFSYSCLGAPAPTLPDLFGVSTVDLREHFAKSGPPSLEPDAGLPRPEAELEASAQRRPWRGIGGTPGRACGRRWRSIPGCEGPGKVDALPLGMATVTVLKDKRVARQGTFTGEQGVEP